MRMLPACALVLGAGLLWAAEPLQPAPGGNPASAVGGPSGLVEKLGNPLRERYPDGSTHHYARTVSDLQAFDGKLYVGHGDIVLNSGLTDVWYYDLRKKVFVKQGQIEDEAADHYRVINGRLYLPGMDPREDWSMGNFYRLESGKWVKHRTLPRSVHSTDIVGIGNTLYATCSYEKPPMSLLESTDDGKTWKAYAVPAGNQRFGRRLIVLDDRLYATTVTAADDLRLYRFNGQGFDACTGDLLPGAMPPPARDDTKFRSWTSLEKPTVFKGKIVYVGARHRVDFTARDVNAAWPLYQTLGLFVATPAGPNGFHVKRSLTEVNLTDIAVAGGRCYVVGFRWKSTTDPKQGAETSVFASADLKRWNKLFSFDADTFATALEVVDGDVYLGLGGSRVYCTPSTGMILKVGKEKLK